MKKLFIIDCMALAYRCFYAYPGLATKGGRLTGVTYGTHGFLQDLIATQRPDYLLAVTDPGGRNFRHEMYNEYKANRKEKAPEFLTQLPDFYTLLEKMNIPLIRYDGFEADDMIGSIAAQMASPDLKIYIVSPDKDFMQCVNENVVLYRPGKFPAVDIVDTRRVYEKMGVAPNQVIDVLALMGDAADNVPGVSGIGEKKAQALIKSMGSLEGVYENLGAINISKFKGLISDQHNAFLSKKLVTIRADLPIPLTIDSMVCGVNTDVLNPFLNELEFTIPAAGESAIATLDEVPF